MKTRSLLFSIIILLFLFNFLISQENPQIFKMIESAGESSDHALADKIMIFDSTKVDVMESGLSYVYIHKLIKVLTLQGAKNLRTIHFDYDTLSAFIEIKEATIFKKDGRVIKIAKDHIYDYPAPARAIYWGMRNKMIAYGRLEVGDAVSYKLMRKGFTYALLMDSEDERYIPPMKGHFYDIVAFWSSYPILEKYYEVSIPLTKNIQYEIYNGELQASKFIHQDKTVYSWKKVDIKPFKNESNMIAISDVAPKLLLSTSPDWEAKSTWFYGVNEDYGSFEFTEEIKNKTLEIIQGAKTDLEKITRLTHWVAEEIRYSGLSMGPGEGFTLHKGEMTFRDRCGVCKDKAGMLITMLRAAGFESYAAMTMARSRIDKIPADQFNHSVTIVKLDGKYKLLDPTWVPGVRELWSSAEQQQEYLMGIPEGAGLMSTPISPPSEHYYRVKGKSALQVDGTIMGEFTIEVEKQSDARFRRIFRGNYINTWQDFFEKMMYHISPATKINNLEYTDPYDLSKPMRITISYEIPKYALLTEKEIIFTPVVATYIFWDRRLNHHLFMNLDEDKKFGFRTSCSRLVEFDETIQLPSGTKIGYLPEFEKFDGSGASFSSNYKENGNKLVFHQKLVLKKRRYEKEDWKSFQNSVKASKDVANTAIILKR